jgi:hypothetical protein
MPTTTNYGWTTPADTDLVKDGASAIRTLGTSIDTTTKNLNPETTLGDISYRSSSANTNTRLGIGTTGQVLTVAGGVPSWAAPGGGKLLQLVQATYSTETTVTSTSFTDTGLSATITPTLATSKILVMVNQSYRYDRVAKDQGINIQLLRGASAIYNSGANEQFYTQANGASEILHFNYASYVYLDSPATTSATTYKTQGKCLYTTNSGSSKYQYGSNTSTMTLLEIGV